MFKALFWRCFNVIWTLWTSDGRRNNVVCLLGSLYFTYRMQPLCRIFFYLSFYTSRSWCSRRCFDVVSTSFERYGRQMDVETTLCAYWEAYTLLTVCNRSVESFSIYLFYTSRSWCSRRKGDSSLTKSTRTNARTKLKSSNSSRYVLCKKEKKEILVGWKLRLRVWNATESYQRLEKWQSIYSAERQVWKRYRWNREVVV